VHSDDGKLCDGAVVGPISVDEFISKYIWERLAIQMVWGRKRGDDKAEL
jgi:hypothetical protein